MEKNAHKSDLKLKKNIYIYIILGVGPSWLSLILSISDSTRARSNLFENHSQEIPWGIKKKSKLWALVPLISWKRSELKTKFKHIQ
jgi:hypothetical protein